MPGMSAPGLKTNRTAWEHSSVVMATAMLVDSAQATSPATAPKSRTSSRMWATCLSVRSWARE
jgi:hypothetical protein